MVGSTRDGAKERGLDAVQAVAKFAANGKALGEGDADGFVQIVAEKGTGRIVGCQIVGPHAVEMIHIVSEAMTFGTPVNGAGRDGVRAPDGVRGHQGGRRRRGREVRLLGAGSRSLPAHVHVPAWGPAPARGVLSSRA